MNTIMPKINSDLEVLDVSPYTPQRTFKLFSGTANLPLGEAVAAHLGVSLGDIQLSRHSDGEQYALIKESVRGDDVYFIQSLCAPTDSGLMQMLISLDAFRRASAREVVAVIPFFAYARQDRKANGRESITAKLVADLIVTAGAQRVFTLDLHSPQIQGFFDIKEVEHAFATPALVEVLRQLIMDLKRQGVREEDIAIGSPDHGGVTRARAYATRLEDLPLVIGDKRRERGKGAEIMNLIGDVKGKVVIEVDDMIDTAGTITEISKTLMSEGAEAVYAAAVFPVLSGPAMKRLDDSPIQAIAVSDAIPLPEKGVSEKIKTYSIARLLAHYLALIFRGKAISPTLGYKY